MGNVGRSQFQCIDMGCGGIVYRLHRQEWSVPAAYLAPRRHGGSNSGEFAVALQHDGRGRRVLGRSSVSSFLGGHEDW